MRVISRDSRQRPFYIKDRRAIYPENTSNIQCMVTSKIRLSVTENPCTLEGTIDQHTEFVLF